MKLVQLPHSCEHSDLLAGLGKALEHPDKDPRIVIQVSPGYFISPAAIALLTAWGLKASANGSKLEFIGSDNHYLSRMDVLSTLNITYEEDFKRHSEAGRFIPVKTIRTFDDCHRAANAICDLVIHHFDNAREFIPALEWAVNEITDNILVHSDSVTPGIICAQFFPTKKRLDVGICDMGRGIWASLGESQELYSHGHAIETALKRGITRNRKIGQGNGMAGTFDIIAANGGDLAIWTGNATFNLASGVKKGFETHAELWNYGIMGTLPFSNKGNVPFE